MTLEEKAKKRRHKHKKPYSSMSFTTGDIGYNISQFNKHMGTDGYLSGSIQPEHVAIAPAMTPDGGIGTMVGGGDSGAGSGDAGGAACESLNLSEATKRYIKRYYIRPQNIICSNKEEILKALVEIGDKNCSVYSLKNLDDHDDVHKLTPQDIIYYYDSGILYDKNHVKVVDYDLSPKHEETRKKFKKEVADAPTADFAKEYDDRLTKASIGKDQDIKIKEAFEDNPFALDFDVLDEDLENEKHEETCCVCGEKIIGYGNNAAPVKDGICCDHCNQTVVIPERIKQMK